MPFAPRAEPRAPEEDDEEAFSLADALATAVAGGEAAAAVGLLDTLVVRRGGGAVGQDGSTPVQELVAAPTVAAYRDAAPVPLVRALGEENVARLLVYLLRNAEAAARAAGAARELAPYLRDREPLARIVGAQILEHEPRLVPHLAALAPELARLSHDELRALLHAAPEVLAKALPRIVHATLPELPRKRRNALAPLVHGIASVNDVHAPDAIRALARVGIPVDRRVRGKLPTEVAATAGALENLRALEELAELRRARSAVAPPPKSPSPRPTKPLPAPVLQTPARSAWVTPAKPWWEAEVRFGHIVALSTVVGALGLGVAMGPPFRIPALCGYALLVAIGMFGFLAKTNPPRARRGRGWRDHDE